MFATYEREIAPSRARLAARRALADAAAGRFEPRVLHRLLIQFCALGYHMTDEVENWIRSAGQRCLELGYESLGGALVAHAKHEAGHQNLFVDDVRSLVARWNASHQPALDARALLSQPYTPGVRAYRRLHEEVIASSTPFAQIAIEYEIEAVSVREGPKIIRAVIDALGAEVAQSLSFVQEHMAVDVGHSKFNALQLERFLQAHPDTSARLLDAGRRALDAYGEFLDDCYGAAGAA